MTDNLSMGHIVRRSATQYPQRTAIIYEGNTYTYAQYNKRVNRAANVLTELGVSFSDHIAVIGRNSIEYLELCHGSAKVGAVFGTINWRLAPKEISFIVTDGDAKVLAVEASLQDVVRPVLDDMPGITIVVYDGEPTLLGDSPGRPEVRGSDPERLRCRAHHRGVRQRRGPDHVHLRHHRASQGRSPHPRNVCWDAISYLTYAAPKPYDMLLVGMPMNHVSGLHMQTSAFLIRGLPMVILRQWDAEEACQLIQKHRVTAATILVTPLQQLLEFEGLHNYDLTSLQLVLTAAAKYTRDLPIETMHRLGIDRLLFGYGLTEAAPLATITELSGEMLANENTLGFPVWYNDVLIVDENDNPVPEGEAGELIIRGPNVFKGYYKRPEVNDQVLRGGWLHTGDLACFRDNNLYFVDRKKDMIKSGGLNVYSLEVEMALLAANPELTGVSVVGVPDAKWGEAVVAFIVAPPGSDLSARTIIERTRAYAAGFKLPKRIYFIDEFPTNVSGKVRKTVLREWVAEDKFTPSTD